MVNHQLLKLSSVSINLYVAMAYIPFQTSDIAFTLTVKGSPLHPCHWLYTTDLHIPFILAAWEAEFWDLAQEKLDYVTIHWKDSLRTATNRCFTMFHLNLCLEKNQTKRPYQQSLFLSWIVDNHPRSDAEVGQSRLYDTSLAATANTKQLANVKSDIPVFEIQKKIIPSDSQC